MILQNEENKMNQISQKLNIISYFNYNNVM